MNIATKISIMGVELTLKEAKIFSRLEPYQRGKRWTHGLEYDFMPMSGQDMGLRLGISTSYLTEALRKLHEVGWVTRHRVKSKHPYAIELTTKGAIALDELKKHRDLYKEIEE